MARPMDLEQKMAAAVQIWDMMPTLRNFFSAGGVGGGEADGEALEHVQALAARWLVDSLALRGELELALARGVPVIGVKEFRDRLTQAEASLRETAAAVARARQRLPLLDPARAEA